MQKIRTICLGQNTNCYLVETAAGFILIDTGFPHQRHILQRALDEAGCHAGNLPLIILTHGDIDHSGNAAYLRTAYGAQLAMHPGDTPMCLTDGETRERNTRPPADFPKVLYLWFISAAIGYFTRKLLYHAKFEPFTPDILVEDGQDLRPLGLEAIVYHTPGHSKGSISLLIPEGALICGDHFGQVWGRVIDTTDDPAFPSTNDKLQRLDVKMVYPGHGAPFAAERAKLWSAAT